MAGVTSLCGPNWRLTVKSPPPVGGVTYQPLAYPSISCGGAEGSPAGTGRFPAGVQALPEDQPERTRGADDLEPRRRRRRSQHPHGRGCQAWRRRSSDRPRSRPSHAVRERGEGGATRSRVEHEPVQVPTGDLAPRRLQCVGSGPELDALGVGPASGHLQPLPLELLGRTDPARDLDPDGSPVDTQQVGAADGGDLSLGRLGREVHAGETDFGDPDGHGDRLLRVPVDRLDLTHGLDGEPDRAP